MDEIPQCVVCSTRFKYNGPKPKLLPCLHAACETCTSSARSIDCCQKTFDIQNATLPTDSIRLAKIIQLTAKFSPSDFLCTHRNDTNQAVSWCQECEELFCEYCQNLHDEFKLTKKHKVKGITDLCVLGQMKAVSSNTYCTKHDMPLAVYDQECQCLVCYQCLSGDHATHRNLTTEEYLESCRKELESWLEKVTQKQKDVSDRLTSSHQLNSALEERTRTLRENIQHAFQQLRTSVDQREKMVLVELDETLEHQRNTNTTRQAFLKSVERNISTAHLYMSMAVQMSSASDLLGLMDCVKDTSQDYVDVNLPGIQEKECSLALSKEGLLDLKKGVAMFGCICTSLNDSALPQLSGEVGRQDRMQQLLEQLKKEIKDADGKCQRGEEREKLLQEEVLHLKKMVNDIGLTRHCLSEPGRDEIWLWCVKLAFDKETVNIRKVHINEDGYLVKKPLFLMPFDSSKTFKKYWGTSSTVPLPMASCLQYWETISQVQVTKPYLEYNLVLEVGVCQTEDRDRNIYVGGQPHSFSVMVVYCLKHASFCREVRQNGSWMSCLPDTFPNTKGSSCSLHFGVVCDAAQGRAALVDVGQGLVMSTFDNVDTSKPLWPMFGVYNGTSAKVGMKLLVGENITMTNEKKELISMLLK